MVAFAVQAGVSIDTRRASACGPVGRAVIGRFTASAALKRILAGGRCSFRLVGEGAFDLAPRPSRPSTSRPPPPSLSYAPAEGEVAPLIVLAPERPTTADRLADAVTARSGSTLLAQGVADLSGVAQIVPGMIETNLGAGRDKIFLRGLSDGPLTGNTQSVVAIYLDDVRLTFNAPDPDLRLTDMERVDVLRGPQGALYGAGSLGGVVHLVSTPPNPDRLETWAQASYGLTAAGGDSQALDGVLNLPFGGGRGAARLVLYREIDGGYLDNPGLGLTNTNQTLRQGGRLAAAFTLPDGWSLSLGGVLQSLNANDTQYTTDPTIPYVRNTAILEPYDNDFGELHFGLHGDAGPAVANLSLAYIHHVLDSRYDASTAPPLGPASGPAAYDEHDANDGMVAEGTLASHPSSPTQWLLGAFFAQTRELGSAALIDLGSPATTVDQSNRVGLLTEGALYGEVVFPLLRGLDLTTGGRLFVYDDAISSTVFAPGFPSATPFFGRVSHVGVAPKLVLSYTPSSTILFYAQAAEGYRGPGINTAATPLEAFGGTAGIVRSYQADELWGLETGLKLRLFDDRLHLRTALFQDDWTGVQSDQLLPSGLPYTANIGDGRDRGVEAEIDYRQAGLNLSGSLLADHPELIRAAPGFTNLVGSDLGAAPEFMANLEAVYGWSLSTSWRFEADGRVSYVGPSQLTLNTVPTRTMTGYTTGRLALSLAQTRWRLTLAVENPADIQGDTFAYGNPFTLRAQRQVTPLRPRMVSLALQVAY